MKCFIVWRKLHVPFDNSIATVPLSNVSLHSDDMTYSLKEALDCVLGWILSPKTPQQDMRKLCKVLFVIADDIVELMN